MRVFLSAMGWVNEPPTGNRLRWHYPASAVDGVRYVGLPDMLLVERAPIRADFVWHMERSGRPWGSSLTPVGWWEDLGTIALAPWPAPVDLKGTQGVRFRYRGPAARIVATDAESLGSAFDRVVTFGDDVVIEGSSLDRLVVHTPAGATLERFRWLDLFEEHPELDWHEIARIGVAGTLQASWDDVQPRHGGPGTMDEDRWVQLADLANQAAVSEPTGNAGTTRWQELEAIAGIRWEHAVVLGWGFFDGPHDDVSSLDRLDSILDQIPDTPVAYRVVDPSGRLELDHSNIAIVMNMVATPVDPPDTPKYEVPEVRLTQDGRFEATYALRWSDVDPAAIGVRYEQEVSESPSIGADPTSGSFFHRTRDAADAPGSGTVARRHDVAFHDVTLRAAAAAVDAWDRESAPSPWSAPTPLELRHSPTPPPLAWARLMGGTVILQRAVPDPFASETDPIGPDEDWMPDAIVERDGQVQVLRRLGLGETVDVTVADPWPVGGGGEHSVLVTGPPGFDASGFVGGTLIVGRVRVRVESAVGSQIRFTPATDGLMNPVLFGAGPATLQQDRNAPGLWTVVRSFSPVELPQSLIFSDSFALDVERTLTYATRVAFLGMVGPIGSPVSVTVIPAPLRVPPPFTVTPLGRDFFARTMVKVELQRVEPGERFTLWWADGWEGDAGWPAGTAFEDRATPGEQAAQKAYVGTILYDVLSLPVPGVRERRVTFGLQRVRGVGGQSAFTTVQVTLPATS